MLAAAGHGEVGVLLPDSGGAQSAGSDLRTALLDAGLTHREVVIQDAGGSDAAQFNAAEHDIGQGARVLILDPVDSGVGRQIEAYAQTRDVQTIDYGNVTPGGSRSYFVGFDDVAAGRELVSGLDHCLTSWGVRHPRLLVLPGPAHDATASALAKGYDEALRPLLTSRRWLEGTPLAGTSDPAVAAAEFETAASKRPRANAALLSDDQTTGAIIKDLQAAHVRPHVFPTTGYGASIEGLQNVLSGYQCGTVYLPTVRVAQAAAALALYVRADIRPPVALVNGTTADTIAQVAVPSVLVNPQWVTSANMATTVLAQGGVRTSELCAGSYVDACRSAGIRP